MPYHWHALKTYAYMSTELEPYQFKPGSANLLEQPDGNWIANFELALYQGQTLKYTDQGIHSENYRVIDVEIEGNENDPVSYSAGSTFPFAKTTEIGVELAAKKGEKVWSTIRTSY